MAGIRTVRRHDAQRAPRQVTLCPGTAGALRLHLIAPRYHPLRAAPYVVLVNGYYVVPLDPDSALLLGCYMDALAPYDGQVLPDEEMGLVIQGAVEKALFYLPLARQRLVGRLGDLLDGFYGLLNGRGAPPGLPDITLREYAPWMRAPHRIDLLVSSLQKNGRWNCNLRCRHCYAAGQPAADLAELSTGQWKQAIDRCGQAGIPQLTFTGGEPTLREDLPELVAYSRQFVTRLNTNGVLLSRRLCTALKAADLDSVQITLYSQDAGVHNALVGADGTHASGGHGKTLAGLDCALAAGLDVSVNTPLCPENRDYAKTLAFLHRRGVRYVSCSGLIQTGRAAGGAGALAGGELKEIVGKAAALCAENGMLLSFTSPGWVEPAFLRDLGLATPVCGAALSNMAVAPDGSVVPCQSWLGSGDCLGNILEDTWRHIWRRPLCRRLRGMREEEAQACPLRARQAGEGVA